MTDEVKAKLIDNNNKISELLKENEKMLRNAGYEPPVNNCVIDKNKRIQFPYGYIRENQIFINKYHLDAVVSKTSTKKILPILCNYLIFIILL